MPKEGRKEGRKEGKSSSDVGRAEGWRRRRRMREEAREEEGTGHRRMEGRNEGKGSRRLHKLSSAAAEPHRINSGVLSKRATRTSGGGWNGRKQEERGTEKRVRLWRAATRRMRWETGRGWWTRSSWVVYHRRGVQELTFLLLRESTSAWHNSSTFWAVRN